MGTKKHSKSKTRKSTKSTKTSKKKHRYEESDNSEDDEFDEPYYSPDESDDHDESDNEDNYVSPSQDKRFVILKRKILCWIENDDKIKEVSKKLKKYKDAKKEEEDTIIKMIAALGADEAKIDVHDNNNIFRGRVYKQKSVTKSAIKEDIIKEALMESIRDERKVNQLVKKIDSRRAVNERYYLKRTRGSNDE